jgi:hypothetical protein
MPVTMTYDLDKKTADEFFAQVDRAMKVLGKSNFQALQWAARLLCQSLGAQTKIASKKPRPIVQNPDPRWETDKRRARFGVMGYAGGNPAFIPIYKKGTEPFYDAKTASWYERTDGRERGNWKRLAFGKRVEPVLVVPSIMDHPRRLIPHRGLAKMAWRKAQALIGSGGSADGMKVRNIASVQINRSETDPSVTLNNKLRYAGAAFVSGESAVGIAMENATSKLMYRIQQERDKQLGLNLK